MNTQLCPLPRVVVLLWWRSDVLKTRASEASFRPHTLLALLRVVEPGFGAGDSATESMDNRGNDLERGVSSGSLALFKVFAVSRHGVGDMSDADHLTAAGGGVGVKSSSFHLDSNGPKALRLFYAMGRLRGKGRQWSRSIR